MSRMITMTTGFLGRAKGLLVREPEPKAAPAKPVKKAPQAFHSVCIVTASSACPGARALKGKRFLSRDAPVLPLKNCDRGGCKCRYEHYEDRRDGPRRAREFGVSIDVYNGPEQRKQVKRGRRNAER